MKKSCESMQRQLMSADLEEQIYRAKELREQELADIEKSIEEEAKAIADRTDQSERWITRQKSLATLQLRMRSQHTTG